MLFKKIIYLSLVTFSAASSLAAAAPRSLIKFPYAVPLVKSSNIYTVINKPVELGACMAIKKAQITKAKANGNTNYTEISTDYINYYSPAINKVVNKMTEIKKICGYDDTCYEKYVSESDAGIVQGFSKTIKIIEAQNFSLDDLGTAALKYCGKVEQR